MTIIKFWIRKHWKIFIIKKRFFPPNYRQDFCVLNFGWTASEGLTLSTGYWAHTYRKSASEKTILVETLPCAPGSCCLSKSGCLFQKYNREWPYTLEFAGQTEGKMCPEGTNPRTWVMSVSVKSVYSHVILFISPFCGSCTSGLSATLQGQDCQSCDNGNAAPVIAVVALLATAFVIFWLYVCFASI